MTGDSSPRERTRIGALRDCSPSAKYVYTVLRNNGTLTRDELVARTLLPERTVQYALDTLTEEGLVRKTVDASDARRRKYSAVPVDWPDVDDC